jgi:hypothetical protein
MASELVLVSSRSDVRDSRQNSHDELGIELDAMSTIGGTLEAIEDPALRQRILNWAIQRWGSVDRAGTDSGESPARHATTMPAANDSDLSVDSIGELFADSPAGMRPESMLESLAVDLQRLADDWNGA